MATNKLIPFVFRKEDARRADVQEFCCGPEPHETPIADWIKNSAIPAIERRTKIWRYETDGMESGMVGFGSLNKGKLELPGQKVMKVIVIPMLALHQNFWGKPGTPASRTSPEEKYSMQVIRHLQAEAREMLKRAEGTEPLLTLYVHPSAGPARNLYAEAGFVPTPHRYHDKTTGDELLGMAFDLRS